MNLCSILVLPYQTAPSYQLPSELITLSRLLTLPHAEFETARTKGRLPKGNPDSAMLSVLNTVLRRRMGMYTGGSIEVRRCAIGIPWLPCPSLLGYLTFWIG